MDQELQFERTEVAVTHTARKCGGCSSELHDVYYQARGAILCERCADSVRNMIQGHGSRLGRFSKALLLGSGAAILGAVLWYAIVAFTGYELGLVAIVIGVLVGRAVRKGSGGRGGIRYQLLAVVLTYLSIVSTYIPLVLKEAAKLQPKTEAAMTVSPDQHVTVPSTGNENATSSAEKADGTISSQTADTPVKAQKTVLTPVKLIFGCVVLVGFAMAVPFLAGAQNVMGILIIGFGVWEAWRVNRRLNIAITGPHSLTAAPTTPPPL